MIRHGLSVLLSAVLAVGGVAVAFYFFGVRVNATASLPIGLYRTTSDLKARLVEFCPPEPVGSMFASRDYRGKGNCPDDAEPLMKPVFAVAGDIVNVSISGVAVNGRLLQNSAPRRLDTNDRPLQHWPFGAYRVCPGTAWVVSSFNTQLRLLVFRPCPDCHHSLSSSSAPNRMILKAFTAEPSGASGAQRKSWI